MLDLISMILFVKCNTSIEYLIHNIPQSTLYPLISKENIYKIFPSNRKL
jgi:hypothetical protein